MSLNAVTKLREHILPDFLDIKQNNDFKDTLSQIPITSPTPGIARYTNPLDTHC